MKGSKALPKDFSARVKEAAKVIRKHSFARVISHHDADGISAAGVIVASLKREGKTFQTTITKNLNDEIAEELAAEKNELTVFLDMGSSVIDPLESFEGDVVILDHHAPIRDSEKVTLVNPHLFGIDGMKDVSASGLAFIVSTFINEKNWASAPIAISGLIGDMQHLHGYSAINSEIIDGAIHRKLITKNHGFRLFGDELHGMIANSVSPFFKGLSGQSDKAREFLSEAGVDGKSSYYEIDEKDRRRILSLLTLRLLSQGANYDTISETYGDILTITANGLRIDDLSELLNACGRTNHPGVGLAVCLGDLNALQDATKFRSDYERALMSSLRIVEQGETESMESVQIIRPTNPALSGAICGISMQYLLDQEKPTIALSKAEGAVRVSARATKACVEAGVDLAESLKVAAGSVGGYGGGHAIAAGASFPMAREEEFLKTLNEMTGKQMKKG